MTEVADSADDEREVRRELLATLLSHRRTVVIGNVLICLTTTVVLLGHGVRDGVLPWATVVLLVAALRSTHAGRLAPRVATLDMAGIHAAERQIFWLMALQGLSWGVLPWVSYSGRNAFLDFFSVAMLVGMNSGAVNSAAPLPQALRIYLLTAQLPFITQSVVLGGGVSLAGGLTIAFSLVVLMAFGRNQHAAMRHALQITRQNARLAEALRIERDAVQTALRAKSLFLAGVSHDLRQPVHAMALHLRFLRSLRSDELSPQRVAALCTPMDGALRAMTAQLTRLLELSRLEAGEAQVARRPIDLPAFLHERLAQFTAQAADQGLRLRSRIGAGARQAWADSDPMMLQSIVDNLLSNAVRYTRRGGVLLVLRPRGGGWLLQVLDSGPGMPEAVLPQLFIAYRRFDDRSNRHDEGQGLGLALVHKQAERLGHALAVRSRVGHGSSFSLLLPACEPPA
ncbi:HAMP domain-containing histidine kinase [Aquincola tertiaricarbonis]|uniref:histidine kinase n=1 Tax=Aquincola tertiaricarbonis TaxID=391953 RepID=A0ABY4S8A5_AQUTE|nr:HAMP domain-containing sensor histidine kinase [Aquincola tertiaricarbonis]URI09592.1 HAMP domain-containing histidine kinase [Aquincola tertiaricarbonis]